MTTEEIIKSVTGREAEHIADHADVLHNHADALEDHEARILVLEGEEAEEAEDVAKDEEEGE
jgi:hypothetical protein